MFIYLVEFSLSLLLPQWMHDQQPDEQHFYRRMFTKKHQKKRSAVKLLWIAMCCIWLVFPYPFLVISSGLFTTFLAFSLMDESG